jgi:hypothetical protein
MVPLKECLGIYPYHAFFSQYVWEKEIFEKDADKDLGCHSAGTSYSWWPSWPGDIFLHSFLWGPTGGASPPI